MSNQKIINGIIELKITFDLDEMPNSLKHRFQKLDDLEIELIALEGARDFIGKELFKMNQGWNWAKLELSDN